MNAIERYYDRAAKQTARKKSRSKRDKKPEDEATQYEQELASYPGAGSVALDHDPAASLFVPLRLRGTQVPAKFSGRHLARLDQRGQRLVNIPAF